MEPLDRAMDAIRAQFEKMQWQPIETAPRDGTRILMADATDMDTGQWTETVWHGIPSGFEDDRYDAAHRFDLGGKQPTHWMPLPGLPQSLHEGVHE
jgi:hypothetical protein